MLMITSSQMKAMDEEATTIIGIPSILLMENAAFKVIENIDLEKYNNFTIIAGVGNNGGDGLSIARQLVIRDKNVAIFTIGNINKASQDFNTNLHILKNMDIAVKHISNKDDLYAFRNSLEENDLTIDAIFATGFNNKVEGLYFDAISFTNLYSLYTVSVDIPSGINADTGAVNGIAIKADKTISFHLMKKGLLGNKSYTGDLIVVDIGIPDKVTKSVLERI